MPGRVVIYLEVVDICSWCKKELGRHFEPEHTIHPALRSAPVSHGMCVPCHDAVLQADAA